MKHPSLNVHSILLLLIVRVFPSCSSEIRLLYRFWSFPSMSLPGNVSVDLHHNNGPKLTQTRGPLLFWYLVVPSSDEFSLQADVM